MATGLHFDAAQMLRNLDAHQQKRLYAVEAAGKVGAAQMESYAKQNAPWQDRSGDARRRMQGKCERREYGVRIILSGGVYYAVYLEYAMKKRWAILWPTIRKLGPEILAQIVRIK